MGAHPPPRTKWTRRVPHPVLIGHAASLSYAGFLQRVLNDLPLSGESDDPDKPRGVGGGARGEPLKAAGVFARRGVAAQRPDGVQVVRAEQLPNF